jgi:MbtH protein
VWGDDSGERRYKVVVNADEQYSIWPEGRQNAPGWADEGKNGTRGECLAHIQAVWTDLRPAGLRRQMENLGG